MSGSGFSPAAAARRTLRLAATGALATLTPAGGPFASLVTVAATPAGAPILLLSELAQHTRNLAADRRASLLLVAPGGEDGDPLAGARLTLTGEVGPRDADPALRRRFLARHREAAGLRRFRRFRLPPVHRRGRPPGRRLRPYRVAVRGGYPCRYRRRRGADRGRRKPACRDERRRRRNHRPVRNRAAWLGRRQLAVDRNRPHRGRSRRRTLSRAA